MATPEERRFYEAIEQNDVDTVKCFIKQNDISLTNWDSTNQTASHIAARCNNLIMMKLLLEKDRSLLDIRDGYDYNVLHRAVEKGYIDMVKCLIEEYKADVNATVHKIYGNSILHIAAAADQLQILRYLIEERHMDANLKNFCGQPAAFSAAANKRIDIIKYLAEERRVDLDILDSNNDNILFISVMRKDLRIPKYLLDDRRLNIDINWRGHWGRTLVFLAARIRATNFVQYLVEEKRADVNIADDNGVTPLHRAAQYNNLKVIKFLLKHKAKLRALDKDGRAAVDLADDDSETSNYLRMVMNRRSRSKRFSATFSNSADEDCQFSHTFQRRLVYSDNAEESFYRQMLIPTIDRLLLTHDTVRSSISNSSSLVATSQIHSLQTRYNFFILLDLLLKYLYSGGKKKCQHLMMWVNGADPVTDIESEKNFSTT